MAVTQTWSNSIALGVTLRECVCTHVGTHVLVHMCVQERGNYHICFGSSLNCTSPFFTHQESAMFPHPTLMNLNSTPKEDKVTGERGQRKAGNRTVYKSLPHPLF